ncbi:MAG: DUF3105 domain-containing protein [Microthrixaceae bacterium]
MTIRRSLPCLGLIAIGALLIVAAACGDSAEVRACDPIERQPLDPASQVHVLGDGADVEYATDPPTSGPHASGTSVDGVVDAPLSRPAQVGVLERGDVLLQHAPDLPAAQIERLEGLAAPGVVVAPNPDLPAAVVATAWTHARRCSSLDVDALRAFIRDRVGKGPDG